MIFRMPLLTIVAPIPKPPRMRPHLPSLSILRKKNEEGSSARRIAVEEITAGEWIEKFTNFQEFASKLETPNDMSIKIFPEKADMREKKILNELAKNYFIDRELQSNNKYRLTKPIFCKQVVRELLKHGYNQNSGFIFMNQFIEYHVDPSTIQNYFRT